MQYTQTANVNKEKWDQTTVDSSWFWWSKAGSSILSLVVLAILLGLLPFLHDPL